jgi:hypothetical protein
VGGGPERDWICVQKEAPKEESEVGFSCEVPPADLPFDIFALLLLREFRMKVSGIKSSEFEMLWNGRVRIEGTYIYCYIYIVIAF